MATLEGWVRRNVPEPLRRHAAWFLLGASLVLAPLTYVALARPLPAAALLGTSVLTLVLVLALVLLVVPLGSYITWRRRLEVFSYRLGIALLIYLAVGVVVVLSINTFSPRTIPFGWPDAARFVPFWPFYTWLVVGCEWVGAVPCPPPPG